MPGWRSVGTALGQGHRAQVSWEAASLIALHLWPPSHCSNRRISELRVIHLLEDLCDGMDSYEMASDAAGERWARSGACGGSMRLLRSGGRQTAGS